MHVCTPGTSSTSDYQIPRVSPMDRMELFDDQQERRDLYETFMPTGRRRIDRNSRVRTVYLPFKRTNEYLVTCMNNEYAAIPSNHLDDARFMQPTWAKIRSERLNRIVEPNPTHPIIITLRERPFQRMTYEQAKQQDDRLREFMRELRTFLGNISRNETPQLVHANKRTYAYVFVNYDYVNFELGRFFTQDGELCETAGNTLVHAWLVSVWSDRNHDFVRY